MKKLVTLASTLLVLSPQLAQAEAYIGGKVGHSWLEGSCPTDSSCSDDDFAGGIYGGYDFSDTFGLEVGFDYLGDFATEINDSMKAFTVAPKFMIPVGDLDLFGKIGTARIDYGDVNDTVMLTAIGAEYGFSDNVFGRLEYQRLNNITAGIVDNLNVNSVFFGLTYKFGASEEPVPMVVEEPAPAPVVVEPAPVVEEPAPKPKLFQEYGVELFDNDSAKLAENSEQYFDWLISVMKKYPQAHAHIIGHTDSVGSEKYNQALSEKRAGSVADYLFSQGIESSRVTVSGMGEIEPKASNDTAEGRMENRRVEVIIDEFEITE
ncbi:OmpA family protein [Vibrio sp. MA40-2]|uniref:OmpA family protein n=1 Tax=Vibrio sp. MA40-2 TaxID=3391828 RepID=UPI0039A4FF8A